MDQTANEADNSTEYTAKLIELFLKLAYPTLEVKLEHSDNNLFRYDQNILFVKYQLIPRIHDLRDELADKYGGKWKDLLRITLSFADGTSARISAINASLRLYR